MKLTFIIVLAVIADYIADFFIAIFQFFGSFKSRQEALK